MSSGGFPTNRVSIILTGAMLTACSLLLPATNCSQHKYSHQAIYDYCQPSNISRTLVGNKIADHSDLVGALPVGAAPITSSFST